MIEIESFDALKNEISSGLTIINVKSSTCSVCVSVSAQLEALTSDFSNKTFSLYIEKVKKFSGQYLVFTVPTIIIFENGKEILRESRFIDFNKIRRVLDIYNN